MTTEADERRRRDALDEIQRLFVANELTLDELLERLGEREVRGGVVPRVLGYLGGLFLFAGVAAFIAINWDSFPSLARVGVTLGVGLALFIAAVVVERQRVWPMFPTPAYLAAEVLQPTGLLVAFEEYGRGGDSRLAFLITGSVLCLQALAVLQISTNSVLVFASILFGAIAAANIFDLAEVAEGFTAVAIGASMVLIALGIERKRYPWNVNAWSGTGSILFYLGAFDLLRSEPLELLFVLFTVVGLYLSIQARIRAILATSVLALLLYISYFTVENFADSLGWPLALMLIGIAFVGLGLVAVRFNRRYFS